MSTNDKKPIERKWYVWSYIKKTPLINAMNHQHQLELENKHINKDKTFWNNILGSDETEINLFNPDGHVYKNQGRSNLTIKTAAVI